MSDLLLYLGITVIGYIIGSRIRSRKDKLSWTGKVQTAAITVLVLLMGMRMGSNHAEFEQYRSISSDHDAADGRLFNIGCFPYQKADEDR